MQRNTGYFPTESLEPCGNRLFSRSALNEGYLFRGSLDKDFEKVKSKVIPKIFSKQNIVCNGIRYDNSTAFYHAYYGKRINFLVDTIKRYKHLKGHHKKDERYLADLLRQ